jgi:hypothetical protein
MITKEQLIGLYVDCYTKVHCNADAEDAKEAYTDELCDCEVIDGYDDFDDLEMSELQWNNLVKVCQAIVSHSELFEMDTYHKATTCGTTHCIAGWGVAVELDDYDANYELYPSNIVEKIADKYVADKYDYDSEKLYACTSSLASLILSPLVYPFFYLIGDSSEESNRIVMHYFIKPILEIAKQENN